MQRFVIALLLASACGGKTALTLEVDSGAAAHDASIRDASVDAAFAADASAGDARVPMDCGIQVTGSVSQEAYVKSESAGYLDHFGSAVAVEGDTLVAGRPGLGSVARPNTANVYVRTDGEWAPQARLTASGTWNSNDDFGSSVAISGSTIVVGAPNDRVDGGVGTGAVYVFVRSGNDWVQQAYLPAPTTAYSSRFGTSVGISGDTLVVGTVLDASAATGVNGDPISQTAEASGSAHVFVRVDGEWTQQAFLKASNTAPWAWFGSSVAISGDTLVVGSKWESGLGTGVNGDDSVDPNPSPGQSGAAYVFARSDNEWTQQAYLKASNAHPGAEFGFSVAIDGDTIVVGAAGEKSRAVGVNGDQLVTRLWKAGAAYVFAWTGTAWIQEAYLKASNTDEWDSFGGSVDISDDTIVIGASGEKSRAHGVDSDQNDNRGSWNGAAYVFERAECGWRQRAYLKASNNEDRDQFGYGVAVSGRTVAVSAPYERSNATGVNGEQVNNEAGESGAVYVFRVTP